MPRPRVYVCARCKTAPKAKGYCYCKPCARAMNSKYRRNGAPILVSRNDTEMCNCGNPACTGLRCNYVRRDVA